MTSMHQHSLLDLPPHDADDMTCGHARSLPNTFGDCFDRQQELGDQSPLDRSELGNLILVQREQRLRPLDVYSMNSIDRRCGQRERLRDNDLLAHFPPAFFAGGPAGTIPSAGPLSPSTANIAGQLSSIRGTAGKCSNHDDKRKDHSSAMRESSSRAFSENHAGIISVGASAYRLRRERAYQLHAIDSAELRA